MKDTDDYDDDIKTKADLKKGVRVLDKDIDLTEKDKGMFGFFKGKRKKETQQERALTLKDMITQADERLTQLIQTKEVELEIEKGSETYNRKALAVLRSMSFHLDEICNLGAEYTTLEKE